LGTKSVIAGKLIAYVITTSFDYVRYIASSDRGDCESELEKM